MDSKFVLMLLMAFSLSMVSLAAELDISNININDLQNQLPGELPKTNLTLDDAKNLVKDKCIKVAGEEKGLEAFNQIETSALEMGECINGIVNFTSIQEEINEASPKGELDVVFHNYCLKRPDAVKCIENFNSKLTPCLDEEERQNQDVFIRIIKSLLSFVCHKGGDQIALFIAEKGPECLEAHKDDIQNCINSTFSGYVPAEGIDSVKSLPKFVMGPKQCEDIEHLESCIVKKLETCEEITPANIVESMFRFIKNETICRSVGKANKQTAASGSSQTLLMSLNSFMCLMCVTAVTYFNRKIIV